MSGRGPEGPAFEQGSRYEGGDPEVLAGALEAAFDYRGDVTLYLSSGEEVQGYLSNRDRKAPEPYVELIPADGSEKRRFPYPAIRGVAFTGRDTAAGKSWETWLRKYKAKKEAESRGEETGTVGLFRETAD